ncbi:MAG: isocitrate lyase/PEP mutase family protein [Cohaesibacter sp.]|nr:isocitrate lyase/PEP mutase family protein [Cohaesibacter sp.]
MSSSFPLPPAQMAHSPAQALRALLEKPCCHIMPCAFDALSARMIAQHGFDVGFMTGFGVSASRIGQPDVGLISYGEMVDSGRNICAAAPRLPIIGDGDTGYGNAVNVKRTVKGYAQAGFAGVMIEDQLAPKRCGHTKGKLVVERSEAVSRIQAAVDARNEGADILIMARTDARHHYGLDEAIERAAAFKEAGADILFVEAPHSLDEMKEITKAVPHKHMANMVEGGDTPLLGADCLFEAGYHLAAYPLTLLSVATKAMSTALELLKQGRHPDDLLLDFADLKKIVGFDAYYEEEKPYSTARDLV